MSERVRAPPKGAKPTPPRASLIQYADPSTFTPTRAAATAAAPAPAATAPAAPAQAAAQQPPSLQLPTSPAHIVAVQDVDEDEHELALGSDEDEPSAAAGDSSATPASPSGSAAAAAVASPRGPSKASLAGAAALRAMEQGSDKLIDALRGSHDDGPLVEDHILESIDYDKDEDYINEDFMEKRGGIHMHFTLLLQFIMTVAIAFVTAMLMYVVSHSTEFLAEFKVESVLSLLEKGNAAGGYFVYLFVSLAFVTAASVLVSIGAPSARGGGVPYVMAYLNGTNVMEYFSLRIVLVKTAALVFTIAGGLTQGMEGPFVFIGGGVAAILNAAMDIVFPFFPRHSSYAKLIRGIREERIFMAGGMAAGLAVAFDAPIAGVLFALEGATAFLSAPVVLRIFGCAMFASFFNDLGHTNFSKYIKNHNLLEVSNSGTPSLYAWNVLEIFPFLIIGVIGGLAGAYATRMNMALSRWRHHHMQGTSSRDVGKQILEIALFCFLTVTPFFSLPYIFGCREKHELCDVHVSALPSRCVQAHCEEGEYSEAATIVYSTANQIAALLFDRSLSWDAEFHAAPLVIYGLLYWVLVSTLYGAYVPGGLFVPSVVIGGIYGRVVGIATKALFPLSTVNPGVYSLLGAASMLGGFTRLALPVVIMLVELTGDATYLLPMMLCSVVGKFTSDAIEPPLYPQHMALEHIPSLTDKVNPIIAKLTAKDIMLPAEKCQTLCTVETLSHIKSLLKTSRRIVFPLVTPQGNLAGLILRRNVMFCISHAPTFRSAAEALAQASTRATHAEELRQAEKQMQDWRSDKYDTAHTITRGSAALEDAYINFTPYMDAGCMTARPATPAKRLSTLFRRVGLSHLCITDKNNIFQGLITRRALITPPPNAAVVGAAHQAQVARGVAAAPTPTAATQAALQTQQQAARRRRQSIINTASAATSIAEEKEDEHKA